MVSGTKIGFRRYGCKFGGVFVGRSYAEYINEALDTEFSGWDFSDIIDTGRMEEDSFDWSYAQTVSSLFADTETLLDIGTGGGELLSSLSPLPARTYATESYPPNVEIAREKLISLGVEVVYIPENPQPPYNDRLPFEESFFDLVISRHNAYCPGEIHRVLKENHLFITEQIGALSCANLLLDLSGNDRMLNHWNLMSAVRELEENSFKIVSKKEHIVPVRFYDIGAIVYYLKAIPWLIEDFTPAKYEKQLRFIDSIIYSRGYYQTLSHGFLVVAEKI